MWRFGLCIMCVLWAHLANGASFSCNIRGLSIIEAAVCADADVSFYDDVLALEYQNDLAKIEIDHRLDYLAYDEIRKGVVARQRDWLTQRNACEHVACLAANYKSRLGVENLRAARGLFHVLINMPADEVLISFASYDGYDFALKSKTRELIFGSASGDFFNGNLMSLDVYRDFELVRSYHTDNGFPFSKLTVQGHDGAFHLLAVSDEMRLRGLQEFEFSVNHDGLSLLRILETGVMRPAVGDMLFEEIDFRRGEVFQKFGHISVDCEMVKSLDRLIVKDSSDLIPSYRGVRESEGWTVEEVNQTTDADIINDFAILWTFDQPNLSRVQFQRAIELGHPLAAQNFVCFEEIVAAMQ